MFTISIVTIIVVYKRAIKEVVADSMMIFMVIAVVVSANLVTFDIVFIIVITAIMVAIRATNFVAAKAIVTIN